ncbi:Spy/CpxP family protein refolding chaperone [Bradyrhizobium sp. AUGA SZCCT0283]|uniref:Spy/CpxP family protein refolding chaperone n=1 Tax=Bradyrhizobium sp. AUGA SZCCT0283 TaxID=2807671 RepID=UPI002899A1C2|nr:Spy/CpxP family protein refolding chaperone [Bradyrhizobium sp. AUGA SZCCT0283]
MSTGSFAQDRRGHGPGGVAAPAARPVGPPPAMARPAAPPAMARPAAPSFRAAPPPQRPAMAPHAPPRIAAPSRPAAPHIVAPRPEIHRAAPSQRPAMTRHPEPRIAAPSSPGASSAVRPSRKEQIETRAQQREQRIQQRQQIVQERQRDMLSRQSTERQNRIDRLQQRVQQLQSQKPEGLRAQRAQQRSLETQNRLLQREQRMQQSDQARLQRLGPQPSAERTAAMQAAARGRFAAQFRSNDALQARAALTARENGWAPRHAWRRGHRAAFVAWLGPVFWPYAYSDIFEYTFWPTAYDPGYWAYAYDDFVDTVFWGTDSPYSAYARYPEPGAAITDFRARGRASVSPRTLRQLCADPDKGVTAWPIAEITRAVRPTPEQRALLDELKAAAAKAADVFKESCADSYAMTPPGRLRAMTNRVSATLNAVKIVRPALEQFYNSLNDEQKARFNALGPNIGERSQQQEANAQAEGCGDPKSSLTQLPIERIEAVVRPAGEQKEALDRLSDVTKKAVAGLQAACPDDVPLTPIGRLDAMEKRLKAMLEAADWVQDALDKFYAALSNEQKARFNTLQQTASP